MGQVSIKDLTPDLQTSAKSYSYLLDSMVLLFSLEENPNANPWLYSTPKYRSILQTISSGPIIFEINDQCAFMKCLNELKELLMKDEGRPEWKVWDDDESRKRACQVHRLLLSIQTSWKEFFSDLPFE